MNNEQLSFLMKTLVKKLCVCSLMIAVPGFVSCSNNDDNEKIIGVESVALSETNPFEMTTGDQITLTATVSPANAPDRTVQWSSSKTSCATVNQEGVVSAYNEGETTIRATSVADPAKYAEVQITVVKPNNPPVLYSNLYGRQLNNNESYPELIVGAATARYTADGLRITGGGNTVQLNKFYALAERMAQYSVTFSADAKAVFQSNTGDFKALVDVPNRRISIATVPVTERTVDFLQGGREYAVEIYHIYQQAKVRIVDKQTGEAAEITAVNDGQGGVGAGSVQAGFSVGMQWDKYCFGLQSGASLLVKEINVQSLKRNIWLLLYGDSITQPEGYFPANDFSRSWTQLVISHVKGNAVSSGRGGGNINDVLERIKNELPYIKAKYVMVTIGTNGGNTEANLSELVEYIISQGAVPILNNIPCNESATQIATNQILEKVRQKYGINGCRFDLATSLNNDGREVDKTTMWLEDYTNGWGQIYHHPNVKGSLQMFNRTLIDIPEIYEQ
jgi:hypothetical protein